MTDSSLCSGLFGKTRQAVLAFLYGQTDSSFYTKQILDAVKTGRGTVQRELKNLTDTGIISREVQGRQVYYRANKSCPIYAELKSIVTKTFGVADVLRQSLGPAARKIQVAFIFGSIASGAEQRTSDIDMMVIGKTTFSEIVSLISPSQKTLGREVNPVVYPTSEFKQKMRENHHFLKIVLEGDKIFLIGDEGELARLVEKRAVKNT
ncbi:MAG: nucleotidyltransferase domain-containing protein [Chloroflexi bacterium]|nr:nucleotidyltransferase domain-containing protein [Chloroflexota bacterium]